MASRNNELPLRAVGSDDPMYSSREYWSPIPCEGFNNIALPLAYLSASGALPFSVSAAGEGIRAPTSSY